MTEEPVPLPLIMVRRLGPVPPTVKVTDKRAIFALLPKASEYLEKAVIFTVAGLESLEGV